MTNRAKEIYEAAVSMTRPSDSYWTDTVTQYIWLAQCTDVERREALRMLDARAAGRST